MGRAAALGAEERAVRVCSRAELEPMLCPSKRMIFASLKAPPLYPSILFRLMLGRARRDAETPTTKCCFLLSLCFSHLRMAG